MSTIRFGLVNLLDPDAFPSVALKNGTGGGAPALEQIAAQPMSMALYRDRYLPWGTSAAPPGTTDFDVDLGADKAVALAAVLGARSTAGPATCVVKSALAAAGYPPGAWTTRATIALGAPTPRDAGAVFAAGTGRYWRFEFTTCTAQFYVGRLWLSALTDLAMLYSKGAIETPIKYGPRDELPGGIPVSATLGDEGRSWQLRFEKVLAATRDQLWAALRTGQPLVLVDDLDAVFEVWLPQRAVPTSRDFFNLYTPTLELARLP